MTEVLLGQAKHKRLGNDLFWEFHKYGDRMAGRFIDLTWTGYDARDWWEKWRKGTEIKEQDDHRFRIDYENCNVYELVDG